MTKDEMLKVLKDSFKDFKFYEDGHYYECKGKRIGVSVTTFIHEYCNEFDELGMAEKSAIKNNKSVQEILNEWHYKRDFSCEKGTDGHNYSQHLWSGNKYEMLKFDMSNEYYQSVFKIHRQAENFYRDYKEHLEHLFDELPIGSEEYDIASCVDHLFYNKLTGGLVLVDYKTNTDIYKDKKYYENSRKKPPKMKIPLQHLEDLTITHYYIQLSIYKFLIEKYTGLEVSEMFIVYFSENIKDYEIIEIPYLKEEVMKILENRREKNMNSIGVLLMGASGTGKSTSLRNLPAEETAIINVTNKPMPFRNKNGLKITSCTNYEQMIKAILSTNKRIIVVDDSSYMMTFENFEKATQKGYDKFTTMAINYYNLIETPKKCDGEKIIYFVTHEEIDENGITHPKSIGKMLSQQLVIEGLFSIVLRSMQKENQYVFQTHNDGTSVCKSPIDMFADDFIPNDLAEVDKIIREYYGFKPITEKLEETKVEEN